MIAAALLWPSAALAGDQTASKQESKQEKKQEKKTDKPETVKKPRQKPGAVVYLNKSIHWDLCAGEQAHRSALVREFFREAFLIAARDELHLATRDQWLGDPMTGEGNNAPFELRTNCAKGSPLEILRGFGPKPPLYKQYAWNLNGDIPYLAAEAEKLSRTNWSDVLKEAGFTGKANQWNRNAALPDGIEQLLSEMVFTSQFHAVRELHAAMPPAANRWPRWAAWSAANANLGRPTEHHCYRRTARSRPGPALCPAHGGPRREVSLDPLVLRRMPCADRAHKFSLEDIEAAAKDAKSAEARAPAEPAWVAIIKAYRHYDLDRLAALRAARRAQLAGLLAYCSAELAGNTKIAVSKAKEPSPSMPERYPFYDGLCANGDLDEIQQGRLRWQTRRRQIHPELSAMSGLPESVTDP